MTKLFLISFSALSRIVFEWGVVVLSWLLWGWPVGVAFLLWYALWTWMGLYLIESIQVQMKGTEKNVNKKLTAFIEAMEEAARKEKKDREEKDGE